MKPNLFFFRLRNSHITILCLTKPPFGIIKLLVRLKEFTMTILQMKARAQLFLQLAVLHGIWRSFSMSAQNLRTRVHEEKISSLCVSLLSSAHMQTMTINLDSR